MIEDHGINLKSQHRKSSRWKFQLLGRKLETGVKGTKIDSSFDNILIKKEAIIDKKLMNINCQIIDVFKAYEIMKKLFKNKKNEYIYPVYK